MTIQNHFFFWGAASVIFLLLIWIFKAILLPFVLGMVIAYLLNPLVNYLGRLKIRRHFAALLIVGLFALIVLVALAAAVPVLYHELQELSEDLPGYMERLKEILAPYSVQIQDLIGQDSEAAVKTLVQDNAGSAVTVTTGILGGLLAGGKAFMNFLSILVITPIVAYFMMAEWPRITAWVENIIPRHSEKTIMQLWKEIDQKLAGFIRGQISVMLILGVAYAIALTIAGLKYGFLIGFGAGLLSIIPLVGSTLGLLVSILVAWFQSGEWSYVAIIAGIFLAGQLIEGNFLTPKVVGANVGLHPLWIFFALLAGGSLLGILGILLAVPIAIVVSVLAAFAIRRYKDSPYYREGKKKNG